MRARERLAVLVGLLFASTAASAQGGPEFGYTQPAAEIRLAFPETGVLRELTVREGQDVTKGQVLGRLDTAVLEAEADMAKAQEELADRRLKALEAIGESGRVSPDELARARAELAIERARAKRVVAQIENRTLRSPVDGLVAEVRREVGESIGPADFHVLTVVVIAELRADLYVPVPVAAARKKGEEVEVLYDGKLRVKATIEFISPLVEPATGTTRMRLSIPNKDGKLASGMKVALASDEPAPDDERR